MVKLRVLEPVRIESGRYAPGSVIDVSDYVAGRLIRFRHAEAIEDPGPEMSGHSDQAIEQADVLREAVPGLKPKPAMALVMAGYVDAESLASVDNQTLAEIDGVAAGTVATIREVAPYHEPDELDTEDE